MFEIMNSLPVNDVMKIKSRYTVLTIRNVLLSVIVNGIPHLDNYADF